MEAMEAEVESHQSKGHWKIRHKDEVPVGTKILPAVWSMKRKRRIATREIYKWKARLMSADKRTEAGTQEETRRV